MTDDQLCSAAGGRKFDTGRSHHDRGRPLLS